MTFPEILNTISIWSITIPLVTGIVGFLRLAADSRLIFAMVVFATIPQLLRFFYAHAVSVNLIYNLYTVVEFFIVFLLIKSKWENALSRRTFFLAATVYVLLSAFLILKIGLVNRFLNEWVVVNNLVFVYWKLLYYIQEFEKDEAVYVDFKSPLGLYMLGILFYAPCTVLIFSLWHYIKAEESSFSGIWTIHSFSNICMYVLFAKGMAIDIRQFGKPGVSQ